MITIFSRTNDATTTEVINWIKQLDKNIKILRINSDDKNIEFVSFNGLTEELLIKVGSEVFDLNDTTVNWYRKGGNPMNKLLKVSFNRSYFKNDSSYIKSHLKNELNVLLDYFGFITESKKFSLGSKFNSTLNKLVVLTKARKYALETPSSFINQSKVELVETCENNGDLITKALSDGIYKFGNGKAHYTYTEKIDSDCVQNLPATYFPSLFQLQVNKKYEVRSFYLNGEFYSMAIFSQNNSKTKVDFRKYDGIKPNRCVPYLLPQEIEEKLSKLINDLGLNTGSIDIIVDENDNFIFLEINPVGQFTMTSIPCNYFLEKKVAKLLIEKYKS